MKFLNIKYRLTVVFVCLLFAFKPTANAQKSILIKGIVRDSVTMAPLFEATISTIKSNLQTKTNLKGFFNIKISPSAKESLTISSVGYKKHTISLAGYQEGDILNINLTSIAIKLNEIIVQDNSAATIVAKAYHNIPFNYPGKETFYQGFYRESSLILNDKGSTDIDYIVESTIDIKKGSYAKARSADEIKLSNSKKTMSIDSGTRGRWFGGISSPSYSDLVKMRKEFLDPKYRKQYAYTKLKDTVLYDQKVYVIQFEPKGSAYYKGKIYISAKSYAFIKINYELTLMGLKHHYFFIIQKPKVKKGILSVNYFPVGDKWFLNNIYHEAEMDLSKIRYSYKAEYITTHVDTADLNNFTLNKKAKIARWERLPNNNIKTDSSYWKNYKLNMLIADRSDILIDTNSKLVGLERQLTPQVKANAKGYLVTPHLHKIITDGLIEYQYELGFGKTQTLLLSTGLISPKWRNIYPFLTIGYRNYYNLQQRADQQKTIWNNSANYFGVKFDLSTKNKLFAFRNDADEQNPSLSLSVLWGMQRQIGKRFGYNYYLGPKITNYTFSNTGKKKIGDVIDIGAGLSYSFK